MSADDPLKEELRATILNGTIPNALLFTGSCEENKLITAITFVKTINCLNSSPSCLPCNSCRSCMKIDAKAHPDIITISPDAEKAIIKIGQIRELCGATASKPHEAMMRMVMIQDAHTMNQEASNALLKILEEPPERTFFILLARGLNDLLPTIISRCRHIRFRPLRVSEIEQRLTHDCGVSPTIANIAAKSSNSDFKKAMILANVYEKEPKNGNQNQRKTEITIEKIDWIKRRKSLLNQLIMVIKPDEDSNSSSSAPSKFLLALIIAEQLSKETKIIQELSITLIKLWLRDMAIVKFSKREEDVNLSQIVNVDFIGKISDLCMRLSDDYPILALESIHLVETKLQTNASVRLILEQFFLNLVIKRG
ncbi:MAG: DNA polymerase III subunit [Desulfamplus sp.]|nr:DNA polymerase III subunit [Desulfamplus sp.]